MENYHYIVNINDNGPHTIFSSDHARCSSCRIESTHVSEIAVERLEQDVFNSFVQIPKESHDCSE